jgi:hypothetical protein
MCESVAGGAHDLTDPLQASGIFLRRIPVLCTVRTGRLSGTTTTLKEDIYAFIFAQKGLMAGLGIQGNKITKIEPK